MTRRLLLLLGFLCATALSCSAQSNVSIALGSGYAGGAATFNNLNPQGYNGLPQPSPSIVILLSSSGAATMTTLGTGTQYRVTACKSDGSACLLATVNVSGLAQDISASLLAYPIGSGSGTGNITGTFVANQVAVATSAQVLSGNTTLVFDPIRAQLYTGTAYASLNNTLWNSISVDPGAAFYHLSDVGVALDTAINKYPRGGFFLSQGRNPIAVEGYSSNYDTTLGDLNNDPVGGQFFGMSTTTVNSVRGAVGVNGYAYTTSDSGHTNGGAVGVNGFAQNSGVGVPVDTSHPLSSFITYGNYSPNSGVNPIPLNAGFMVGGTMSNLGGGAATTNAAFYAVDQGASNYAIKTGTGIVDFGGTLLVGIPDSSLNINAQGSLSDGPIQGRVIGAYTAAVQGLSQSTPGGVAIGGAFNGFAIGNASSATGISGIVAAVPGMGNTVGGIIAVDTYRPIIGPGTVMQSVGLNVPDSALSSGAVLTNNYGIVVADQTSGVTNYAFRSGLGLILFGDAVTGPTFNNLTITTPATGSTLTIADGKTLTASNTLMFTGTDSSSVAFGAGGTVAYTGGNIATSSLAVGGGTAITKVLSNTATLDFGSLVAIGCEDLTLTVTGAVDGDEVIVGAPNAAYVSQTSTYSGFVSSSDTVKVRYCALVSGDPPSSSFRATVVHY